MKIIVLIASILGLLNAGVQSTTIGCEDKKNSIELKKLMDNKQLDSHLKLIKYVQNNNCYIIEPKDKIKIVGKVKNKEFLKVYVNKIDREVYIKENQIKYKFNQDNHLFNKSF